MRGARPAVSSLSLVGAAFGSAGMALLSHHAGQHGHWSIVAASRLLVGLFVAIVAALVLGQRELRRPGEFWAWVRSAAAAVGVPTAFIALVELPPADAAAIMATSPLHFLMLDSVVRRTTPPSRGVVGSALALVGILLLERPGFHLTGLGGLAVFVNAVMQGLAALASARVARTGAVELTLQATLAASVTTLGFVLWHFAHLDNSSQFAWAPILPSLIGVGVLATATNSLSSFGLGKGDARRLAPLLFLGPPTALFGEWLFGASIPAEHLLAMSLVLLGAAWGTTGRRSERLVVSGNTPAPVPQVTDIERALRRIRERTQADIQVKITAPGAGDPLIGASERLGGPSDGHRLLVIRAPGQRVIVAGQWLERRLLSHRLRRILADDDELRFWTRLEDELVRLVPARLPSSTDGPG